MTINKKYFKDNVQLMADSMHEHDKHHFDQAIENLADLCNLHTVTMKAYLLMICFSWSAKDNDLETCNLVVDSLAKLFGVPRWVAIVTILSESEGSKPDHTVIKKILGDDLDAHGY